MSTGDVDRIVFRQHSHCGNSKPLSCISMFHSFQTVSDCFSVSILRSLNLRLPPPSHRPPTALSPPSHRPPSVAPPRDSAGDPLRPEIWVQDLRQRHLHRHPARFQSTQNTNHVTMNFHVGLNNGALLSEDQSNHPLDLWRRFCKKIPTVSYRFQLVPTGFFIFSFSHRLIAGVHPHRLRVIRLVRSIG